MRLAALFLVVTSVLLFAGSAHAQPRTDPSLGITVGAGFSFPDDDSDVSGSGLYATVEYVKFVTRWIGLRPYAGLLITTPDDDDERCAQVGRQCEVTANIGFLGAKARLALPIPYVAPFLEIGFGASVGSLRTLTPDTDDEVNGVTSHVVLNIGMAIGRHHEVEISLPTTIHSAAQQFEGAIAFGFNLAL